MILELFQFYDVSSSNSNKDNNTNDSNNSNGKLRIMVIILIHLQPNLFLILIHKQILTLLNNHY